MLKQMMISKHLNISIADSDQMTPFDLNFYFQKMQKMFKEEKEALEQAHKR